MKYNDWIDNADSYLCPQCGYEVNNPNNLPEHICPKCGFQPKKFEGAKDDQGKLKLSKVPPEIIEAIAAVRRFGAQKYGSAEDWKTITPDRWHEALLRHTLAMWDDPWHKDAESGLPSLWHVATNAAFLCANFAQQTERGRKEK